MPDAPNALVAKPGSRLRALGMGHEANELFASLVNEADELLEDQALQLRKG
jgi:hypothetical protein